MADESPAVEEQEPLCPPSTTLFPVSKQTPSAPINPSLSSAIPTRIKAIH
ncbi:hypothetical protein HanPSC8_Chr11g0491571 [Helianthus annuus]|nr:hypothetical protein HanPSC8_Chr11g0491571 [Helianthus annuus]